MAQIGGGRERIQLSEILKFRQQVFFWKPRDIENESRLHETQINRKNGLIRYTPALLNNIETFTSRKPRPIIIDTFVVAFA